MSAKGSAAPIDQSVRVPAAVRRASEAASAIHAQAYTPEGEVPADPPTEPTPAPDTTPPLTPDPAPAPAAPVVPETAAQGDSWEQRYKAAKGRLDRSEDTVRQLSGRVTQLEQILAAAPAPAPAPVTPPELRATSLVTKEERESYGDELLDVVGRRAQEAIQPMLDARDAEIARLTNQLGNVSGFVAATTRDQMIRQLDSEIPDWRAQNSDHAFMDWLLLPDAYSGAIRQTLLKQAWEQNESPRVLAIFKGFLSEKAAVAPAVAIPAPVVKPGLETFAAPGRARSAAPANGGTPEKPIITRTEIAAFYAEVAAGKYVNNPAEKERLEKMLFSAQQDGRIR